MKNGEATAMIKSDDYKEIKLNGNRWSLLRPKLFVYFFLFFNRTLIPEPPKILVCSLNDILISECPLRAVLQSYSSKSGSR
jgi:hypothetical protein